MGLRVEIIRPTWLIRGHPRQADICRHAPSGLALAGHSVKILAAPTWGSDWIILWGLGHPEAQAVLEKARRKDVRVVGFDLGYWCRALPNMKYRLSVDDAHPGERLMAKRRSASRLEADGIRLREDARSSGAVVLVGMGHKSAATYGEQPGQWEDKALRKIRRGWPGRDVVFRPKPGGGDHRPAGVPVAEGMAIEEVLRGKAAVYCRQSNVAVDALVAGVPAIAEEGAASSICDKELVPGRLPTLPSRETRWEFLANLAWFQWSGSEMARPDMWKVVEDIVESGR